MTTSLVSVKFHGDKLAAHQDADGQIWVSLRRCCDNLGVDMKSQLTKLKTTEWATMVKITTVDNRGRNRPLTMIHIDSLPMWLAGIHARKVAPELREKLSRYQKEAAKVLADHFYGRYQQQAGINPQLVNNLMEMMAQQAKFLQVVSEKIIAMDQTTKMLNTSRDAVETIQYHPVGYGLTLRQTERRALAIRYIMCEGCDLSDRDIDAICCLSPGYTSRLRRKFKGVAPDPVKSRAAKARHKFYDPRELPPGLN